jgi:hypothetical protein
MNRAKDGLVRYVAFFPNLLNKSKTNILYSRLLSK